MKEKQSNYKPFSSHRWNQEMGAVPTGETFELTDEDKKYLEEQDKKWQETLKKLKEKKVAKK